MSEERRLLSKFSPAATGARDEGCAGIQSKLTVLSHK